MPQRAPKRCNAIGCREFIPHSESHCSKHKLEISQAYDLAANRKEQIYRTYDWQKVRGEVLRQEPLCRHCSKAGLTVLANVVDHIIPIKHGGAEFNLENLQPLCVACHNKKTKQEQEQRRKRNV